MKWTLTALCVLVVFPPYVCAQTPDAAVQREMSKIDALCADPDLKLAVVAAMADSVQVHRNHLLLLHKDTGQSFATIFVSELRARGIGDEGILRSLSALRRDVNRQLARYNVATPNATAPRPVLSVRSSVDYNSSGTLYSLVPEFGVDSSHAAVVVGIPYYRTFGTNVSSSGVGDVYVAGFLRGRTAGLDFGSERIVRRGLRCLRCRLLAGPNCEIGLRIGAHSRCANGRSEQGVRIGQSHHRCYRNHGSAPRVCAPVGVGGVRQLGLQQRRLPAPVRYGWKRNPCQRWCGFHTAA